MLVDDLVTRGVTEPYRMFTSRAEYRLSLREDNADIRLTETGRKLGLVDDQRWQAFCEKRESIDRETARLRAALVGPKRFPEKALETLGTGPLDREIPAMELLKRPEVTYQRLVQLTDHQGEQPLMPAADVSRQAQEQVEIQAKYAGYISRQQEEVNRNAAQEEALIPEDMDYRMVRGLSIEVSQKLSAVMPKTLGQASRISGVTPAAISLLWIHIKRLRAGRNLASGEQAA